MKLKTVKLVTVADEACAADPCNRCFNSELNNILPRDITLDKHDVILKSSPKPAYNRWCHIYTSPPSGDVIITIAYVDRFVDGAPRIVIEGASILRATDESNMESVRRIIYTLRDVLGSKIKWVSFGQHQSVDDHQILRQKGFKTGTCSVTSDMKNVARTAILDGRLDVAGNLRESYYRDAMDSIVDPDKKWDDKANGIVVVVYRLSLIREIWYQARTPVRDGLNRIGCRSDKRTTLASEETVSDDLACFNPEDGRSAS